jgi:hypothetical protein
MPMFGAKKFPYTLAGEKAAAAYGKKTGKKMTVKKTAAKKAMPKKMGKKK